MNRMKVNLQNYENELKAINEELDTLPPGSLVKRETRYTYLDNGKESGITKNTDLIRLLCRKKYLLNRKKQLENNVSTLRRSINNFNEDSAEEIIRALPLTYQGVPKDYFFHPSIKNWLEAPHQKNLYQEEKSVFTSNKGVALRSKSELLIANQLEELKIPYLYDVAVILGKKKIYPDFIIKNPYNGTDIIWEHFGALHKDEYVEKMYNKMRLYKAEGYKLFENLIYTFEPDVENVGNLRNLINQLILKSN